MFAKAFLPELNLRNIGLASDSEHDWQRTLWRSRSSETITDKIHVCISFFDETHSQQDVDAKARITNPAESIVPISNHH